MDTQRSDRPVLVGVRDPEHVQQLVRTAADLASLAAGTVRLVTVAVKPYDSPFGVFADDTIVSEYARDSHALLERATTPLDVALDREVVVARSVARGLLAAIDETDPAALVVGWHGGARRSDAALGRTVDALVERAPCDLYVEHVGREANGVDSVLLPVAGGPHVRVAATAAAVIAGRNDAQVVVLTVATPDIGDRAEAFVEEGRAAVGEVRGVDPPIETSVIEGEDATDAVVEAASAHDVVVLGATRQGAVRRQLAWTVPRQVVGRTDRTVILARDGDVVGGPLFRLRELFRR